MAYEDDSFDADEILREPDDSFTEEGKGEEESELQELELGPNSYNELDISEEDEDALLSL